MKCGVTVSSPHSDSQQNIFVDSVPKQPDDFQFVQSIEQRIMGLANSIQEKWPRCKFCDAVDKEKTASVRE